MLYSIDLALIHWLNGFVGRSVLFDKALDQVLHVDLIRTSPLVAALWWVWFSGADEVSRRKSRFIAFAGTLGVLLACLLSRVLQNAIGRTRPLYTPDLHLNVLSSLPERVLADLNSFPSDTAALGFSLATVVWLRSRPVGVAAYLWALAMVSLPRTVVGFHWPLDLVGGALLGTGLVLLLTCSRLKVPLNQALTRLVLPLEQRYTGLFYAALFLLSYQIGTVFDDIRDLGHSLLQAIKIIHG